MPSTLLGAIRAVVLLASAAMAAGAQHDTARTTRDTLRLPAIRITSGSVFSAAGPAVGSFPARVAILPGEAFRPLRGPSFPEAMAGEAGVAFYDDVGARSKTTLTMRGFAVSPVVGLPQGVSVFLDGIPVNESDAGQVNFDLLPLDDVERIELLRGTASLLGPYSLAGAVNVITRRPGAAPGELELTVGSFGRRELRLSDGGTLGGLAYYASASIGDERGWRQRTGERNMHGLASLERRWNDAAAIRLQIQTARSRAETAGSLPMSLYAVRPDSNFTAGDFEDLTQLHIALSGDQSAWGGHGSAAVYLRSNDAERFNVNQATDPDARNFSRNRTLGAQYSWAMQRALRGALVGVRAGAGGTSNRTTIRIFAERVDPGLTTDVESPQTKLDGFTSIDVVAGAFTVSSGARYDFIRVPFRNRLSQRDTTSTFRRLSPRVGVSAALGGATIYASLGRSFRAPALIELACADPNEPCPLPFALGDDPPLVPVVATTMEAGGTWRVRSSVWSMSAYRTNVVDDIFLFPYQDATAPSGSTIAGFFANIAATRREGAEITGEWVIGRTGVFANYAWTRATFQVDDVEIFSVRENDGGSNIVHKGDRMPLVPSHTVAAGMRIALLRDVSLGMNARYTGERFLRGDEANETSPVPGFWLADGRVEWTRSLWTIRAAVFNVLARGYASFGTFNINQSSGALERFLTPGAPRSLQLSASRAFGQRQKAERPARAALFY